MNITYSERARSGDEFGLLQKATASLEQVLGRSAHRVTGQWDRVENEGGQPVYTLRLTDAADSAIASFHLNDLVDPPIARIRLALLWDAVLSERGRKIIEGWNLPDVGET